MTNRDFKGVWIPKEVYLNTQLSLIEKILLVEITSLDNEKGCFAGNSYFASFLGVSITSISLGIKKLIELGYIEKVSFDGRKRILKCTNKDFESEVAKDKKPAFQKVKGTHSKSENIIIHNTNTSNNTYKDCVALYDNFCKEQTGMKCKMNASEGKAMKEIISYLTANIEDQNISRALAFIFKNWNKVEPFYQKQIKLKQINSNLVNIIKQLKNESEKSRSSIEARIRSRINSQQHFGI
jgi:DNA-binding transcriptional regulator GbsR (MarR family)